MATRSEIRDWADERFQGWAKRQERWLKHFGEYCQLLHEPELPDGETEKSGELNYGKPADRPWNGAEFFKLGAKKTNLKRLAEILELEEKDKVDKSDSIEAKKVVESEKDDDESERMSRRQASVAFDVREDENGKSWTMRVAYETSKGRTWEYRRGRDDSKGKWEELETE